VQKISLAGLALVLGLAGASAFQSNRHRISSEYYDVNQNLNGAFRDGLYLGRLAGERGSEPHAAIARWASAEDRASFAKGYQQGYNEFLASRVTPVPPVPHAE